MKRFNSSISKKTFLIMAVLVCMFSLAFGSVSVHAASAKTSAKKKIAAAVKSQYKEIKSYAKTTKYKISKDKKVGKLKKAKEDAYAQKWTILLKHKELGVNLEIAIENTYSSSDEKVIPQIHADVVFEKTPVGEGKDLKSVAALKKLMKKCSTEKGFRSYAKAASKNADSDYQANWRIYCSYCRTTYPSLSSYIGHLGLFYHWDNYNRSRGRY